MQNVCANQIESNFPEMFQGKNNRHEDLKYNVCTKKYVLYIYMHLESKWPLFLIEKGFIFTVLSNEIDEKQISGF